MLLFSKNLLLINAVAFRREFTLFTRVAIIILLYSAIIYSIYTGICVYNVYSTQLHKIFNPYLMSIVPILSYPNADTMKPKVLKDNKEKSGIYR